MTEIPWVLWLDDAGAAGHPALGGKFANLAEMTAAGFAVPRGFGITTVAYRAFVDSAGLGEEIRRIREAAPAMELAAIRSETAALVEAIRTRPLPAALEAAVRQSYAALERRADLPEVPVAVRSSGESEDLAGASFAGQYETYLWIRGIDALLDHMRACWAGMFNETVLSYRQDGETLIAKRDFAICVGVQEMVRARAAGVMFTLDPLNGDRSKIAIESCWGLGEGVVKGDVTPSQFIIDKVTFETVRRTINPQSVEYRFDPEAGAVRLAAIPPEQQDRPCISDSELGDLARLAKHIERTRGGPQDIEWAVSDAGEIWVLQVRPETVWSRRSTEAVMASTPKSAVSHVLSRLSGVRLTKPVSGAGRS